jgi:hypothetical protein
MRGVSVLCVVLAVLAASVACYKDVAIEANEELPYLPSVLNDNCKMLRGTWVFAGSSTGRIYFDDCKAWVFMVGEECPLFRSGEANSTEARGASSKKPASNNKVAAEKPKESANKKVLGGSRIYPNTECSECAMAHGFHDGPFTGPDFQIRAWHYPGFYCTLISETEFDCSSEYENIYYNFVRRDTVIDYDLKEAIAYLNRQEGGSWWQACTQN